MMKCCKYLFVMCAIGSLAGLDARAADTAANGLATTNYVNEAIKTVDGNLTGITNDVAKLGTQMKAANDKIEGLESITNDLGAKVPVLDKTVADHEERISSLEADYQALDDSVLRNVSGGAAVDGKVVTAVVKSGTAVSVTMDYVKIPVGSATNPTGVAQIWVQ